MTPNYWQKIEEIFQVAVELPSREERELYLDEVCADDEDLRIEVEHLLRQDEEADSLLSEPLMDNSGLHIFASMIEERDPTIGREIGAYRILSEIGRGGMGAVYLAERADGSFKQQVAIKIIKRGMDTDFILRRFRRERQILANLSHPFIARLLDGGTTDDDLPFFVMEYIEGKTLYKFADANKLSITERLKLFRQVCEAIEFAHQNQIVHRDVKPSNILVTADGVPKLLDFGIAKVLDAEANVDITLEPTATAVRMMTPEYASPEQVSGLPITPASDIYSLGVLLYELLTGHRPYRFKNRAPHEIARVICEEEPEKPSTSITQSENLLPTGASEATTLIDVCLLRGAENFEDLRRELKGDLEKIILKTLRKNAAERYQTAAELAADISRFLEGERISAESFTEIVSATEKTLPMQSDGTKSLAVLPLKILNLSPKPETTGDDFLSIGLADAMITRLSGIRRLAVRPTSAILEYGDDAVNPLQAGKDLAVDFVLDGRIKILGKKIRVSLQLLDVKKRISVWANQFDEIFTDALELEDKISEKVAEVLLPELTTTEKNRIKKQGTDNAEAFDAYLRGRFFWNKFTPEFLPKALELFQRAVALDPNYAMAHASLADYYNWAGIYGILPTKESAPKAKAAALRALEIDGELAEAMAAYALTLASVDWNYPESEKLYLRAIELHPNYSLAYEWYAASLVGTGRFEEGVEMIHRSEKANPLSLRAMTLTAWTLYQAGKFSEAVAKAEKIAQLDRNFPQAYIQLANALPHVGRTSEAVTAAEQADRMMPNTGVAKYVLCFALVADGRHEEARKILQQVEKLNAEQYVKPYFMAMVYTALDETDKAYEFFVKAFDEHDQWLNWFGTEIKLKKIRREPRFIKLFRRMKNPLAEKLAEEAKTTKTGEKSIAVLPLKIIGAASEEDTGSEFLSVGLADAMITRLSNVRRFAVRPTSAVLCCEKNANDFEIGRMLGVDFIVTGNLRRGGERLRISAQLLSIKENSIRWAQNIDEDFKDVLTLEDTVAEQITKAILPHLTGEEEKQLKKRGTDNTQAFEAYLRGRFYWNTFTEEGFAKALIFYNQAIAIAPDYALAYAGIADYYNLLGVYAVMPFHETSAAAKESALKAIAADVNLAEGYASLGFAVLMHDFDWQKAEKNLRRAVELNPNFVTGRIWLAYFLGLKGEHEEALTHVRRAFELDPLTPVVSHSLNMNLYYAGRFDEAISATEKFIEREPRYSMAQLFLSSMLWKTDRKQDAIKYANRAITLQGRTSYTLIWLASAHAANGETDRALKIIEEIECDNSRRYCSPYLMAMIYANLNDKEKTLELLEKALTERDGRLVWLGVDPQFYEFRVDERFREILRQTNNPIMSEKSA